jgi:hypothetical protein
MGLTQNTVWVLDFAFTFPLMALGAIWLWRRAAWGYVIAGGMLVMLTIETASISVDQIFGQLHDPNASAAAAPAMLVFTLAGVICSTVFLGRMERANARGEAPLHGAPSGAAITSL